MTDNDFITLNEDFDDFLHKVVMNYDVNYSSLAGIIMARMVSLAKVSNNENTLLGLLPHMQESLNEKTDGTIH